MSLLSFLLPDADLPSTIENASEMPAETLPIEDLKAYDDVIAKGLEEGAKRLEEARAAGR